MRTERIYLRAALVAAGQLVALSALFAGLIALAMALDVHWGLNVYDWLMWGALPLLGAVGAWAAVRLGLSYWLAWIAPPICQVIGHLAVIGFLPASPGMPMVVLLLAALGGTAGEEQLRRMRPKKTKRGEDKRRGKG